MNKIRYTALALVAVFCIATISTVQAGGQYGIPSRGRGINLLSLVNKAVANARFPVGDINHDCVVNNHDLRLVREFFGEERGDPRYLPGVDVNDDGRINIFDLATVGRHYGGKC